MLVLAMDRAGSKANGLLRQVPGDTATVRANWRYQDGTDGTASAEEQVFR